MADELVSQFIMPKCEGRAFEVKQGQVLRVIAVEGKQVGDLITVRTPSGEREFEIRNLITIHEST